MTERITAVDPVDVRFPASRARGRSATGVTVRTSDDREGFGLAGTVGRDNEIAVAAVRSLAPLVVGLPVEDVFADLTPEELVSLVDFRYLADALTPGEALAILRAAVPGRARRREELLGDGYPAYPTAPGRLGNTDDELVRLAMAAVDDGFTQLALEVGADQVAGERRLRLARGVVGHDMRIVLHANQAWGVEEAVEWLRPLEPYDPYWIEEPTSSDDVLGHAVIRKAVTPVKVVTGAHTHNAVLVKQLLRAGAVDVLRIDASRVAGITENVAILLLAAKFGVPVCPCAGGVGLGETARHLAMFDYVAVSGTTEDRMIEYADHLHEHFVDPVRIRGGRCLAPTEPGLGARLHPESVARFRFPDGAAWAAEVAG